MAPTKNAVSAVWWPPGAAKLRRDLAAKDAEKQLYDSITPGRIAATAAWFAFQAFQTKQQGLCFSVVDPHPGHA